MQSALTLWLHRPEVQQPHTWYANADETVIGVILLDTIDDDYVAIVLGRDEGGRFRAFDLEVSIQTMDEAVDWVIGTIILHTSTGKKVFPQGDARKV